MSQLSKLGFCALSLVVVSALRLRTASMAACGWRAARAVKASRPNAANISWALRSCSREGTSVVSAQPVAVEQVGAGPVRRGWGSAEPLDRLLIGQVCLVGAGQQGRGARLQAKGAVGAGGSGHPGESSSGVDALLVRFGRLGPGGGLDRCEYRTAIPGGAPGVHPGAIDERVSAG